MIYTHHSLSTLTHSHSLPTHSPQSLYSHSLPLTPHTLTTVSLLSLTPTHSPHTHHSLSTLTHSHSLPTHSPQSLYSHSLPLTPTHLPQSLYSHSLPLTPHTLTTLTTVCWTSFILWWRILLMTPGISTTFSLPTCSRVWSIVMNVPVLPTPALQGGGGIHSGNSLNMFKL